MYEFKLKNDRLLSGEHLAAALKINFSDMSHTTKSNSQNHVNNNIESNSPRPVQSTQERQNSTSASNQHALDITDRTAYSTRFNTQRNLGRSSAGNNATSSSIQSNINTPYVHGFDFSGSSSQSNATIPNMQSINFRPTSQIHDDDPRSYRSRRSRFVRKTLSGLTAESWAQFNARDNTHDNQFFSQITPEEIEYRQVGQDWYRIVSVDVESNESLPSPQPQKIQRTTNGQRSTAGVTNSQSDADWYHKVNRDVTESQQSASTSQSERLERQNQSCSIGSRPESSVNDFPLAGSQSELITSNTWSDESVRYESPPLSPFDLYAIDSSPESPDDPEDNFSLASVPLSQLIASDTWYNERERYQSDNVTHTINLDSNQTSDVSVISNSEPSAAQDTVFVPSSSVTNNSSRVKVYIDLDEFDSDIEEEPHPFLPDNSDAVNSNAVSSNAVSSNAVSSSAVSSSAVSSNAVSSNAVSSNAVSSNAVSSNPETNTIGNIPAPPQTYSSEINQPESVEVVIRSRNNPNYSFIISDPAIIQMHRVLERCINSSNNSRSDENSEIMYQQVNNYIQILRNTIISTDSNSSNISSTMSESIPRTLTINSESYSLLDFASRMPPVITIDRFQKGCFIKELANCVICLEDNIGNVLFEPCMHYNVCGPCMEKLETWKCPICRSRIAKIIVYV